MPEDRSPTSTLVRRAQAGEVRAFEALYRRHVGRVYGLCLRLTGDSEYAEELTQDVFVRVWRNLESFRGDSAFSSWLYRVTVNVVFGWTRSRKSRRARFVADEAQDIVDTEDRASAVVGIDLERAIRSLPPRARTVFVMYDVEGFPQKEIAELLCIATGTVKAHLHRARRLLREALTR